MKREAITRAVQYILSWHIHDTLPNVLQYHVQLYMAHRCMDVLHSFGIHPHYESC